MQKTSTHKPTPVEIISEKGGKAFVALRQNIEENTTTDLLTSTTSPIYTYEEVVVVARKRPNLLSSISQNFTAWFTKGEKIEQLQADLSATQAEIRKLVEDGEQIKVNADLSEKSMQALIGLADSYEQVMQAEDYINAALLAITELYELIEEVL